MAQGAFVVRPDPTDPADIRFDTIPTVPDIPEDQQKFVDEAHRTLTVLRGLFAANDPKFQGYYNSLLGLCRFAVAGPTAQPEHGLRALLTYQLDVTAREGGRIKNTYMISLGISALWLSIPVLLIAWGLFYTGVVDIAPVAFFLLWSGCMAGVWLSFGSRKTTVKFESLHILEEDRLEPVIRLIFAGLLTLVLGLLFTTKAVTVTIGELSTAAIATDLRIAILLGLLCGISEQALSSTVTEQAAKFLKFS